VRGFTRVFTLRQRTKKPAPAKKRLACWVPFSVCCWATRLYTPLLLRYRHLKMDRIILAELPLEGQGFLQMPNLPLDADGNVDSSPAALEKALKENPPDSKNLVVYGGFFPSTSCVLNTELKVFRNNVLGVLERVAEDMYRHLAHQCERYYQSDASPEEQRATQSRAEQLFGNRLIDKSGVTDDPPECIFAFDSAPRVSTSPAELEWRKSNGMPEYSKKELDSSSAGYIIQRDDVLRDLDAVIPADIKDSGLRDRMKWRIEFLLDLAVTLQRAWATIEHIESAEGRIISTGKKASYVAVVAGRYPRQSMRDHLLDDIQLNRVPPEGMDDALSAEMQAELDARMREFDDLADDSDHKPYMSNVDSVYISHDITCASIALDYEAAVEQGVSQHLYRLIDLIGARAFVCSVHTLLRNAAVDMHTARGSLAMNEPVGDYASLLTKDPEAHIELPDPLSKTWHAGSFASILNPEGDVGNQAMAAELWKLLEISAMAQEAFLFFTAAFTMIYLRGMFISVPRDGQEQEQEQGRVDTHLAAKTAADAVSRIVMTAQHESGRSYVTGRNAIGEFMDSIQKRHIIDRDADGGDKKGSRGNVREGDMPFLGADVWKYSERVVYRYMALRSVLQAREAASKEAESTGPAEAATDAPGDLAITTPEDVPVRRDEGGPSDAK